MDDKQSLYQFTQKPLFVFCKELFDNPLNSDVVSRNSEK